MIYIYMYVYGKIDKQRKQAHVGLRDRRVTTGASLFPFPFLCLFPQNATGRHFQTHTQATHKYTHSPNQLSLSHSVSVYEQPTLYLTHTNPH